MKTQRRTVLTIILNSLDEYIILFGSNDANIKIIEEMLDVRIKQMDGVVQITGEKTNTQAAKAVVDKLIALSNQNQTVDSETVRNVVFEILEGIEHENETEAFAYTYKGKPIFSKTNGQQRLVDSILNNVLTIATGPAGTGKTFISIALAVNALKNKEVERLILTRPAVEAGEKLGFLPGDLTQKIDPYLRPIYDSLFEMVGAEGFQRYQERGMIEVAPLAYMRGRTLSNSFIILDEAQNTSPEQMKMFLTRIGNNSKCVVNGDLTQIDLPLFKQNGLKEAVSILKNIDNIGIVALTSKDVVRNEIVQKIVLAYENYRNKTKDDKNADN